MYLLKENPIVCQHESLVSLLHQRALEQPHKLAYSFLLNGEIESNQLTFKELDQKARLLGSVLQNLGLRGKRALLMYQPSLDFITAFFGCLYAGVIAVPAYPPRRNQSIDRLQAIIKDCQATEILTTTTIQKNLEENIDSYADLKTLRWLTTDNLAGNFPINTEFTNPSSDNLAFLQYTSGSTGTPKGVMVSHGNLIHNEEMLTLAKTVGNYQQELVYASWLPLFHDMGLIGVVFQSLYLGVPCILMSPVDFLQKPVRWLEMISKYGATTSGGPNFAYDLCVRKVTPEQMQGLDLSSWNIAFNGSEPIRAETLDNFAAKFAGCGFRKQAFYPCYGMAEATLFMTGGSKRDQPLTATVEEAALENNLIVPAQPGQPGTKTFVGCGHTWMQQKLMIVNPETLTRCPQGQVGEIWVKGESVTQGYWNQPEKTQETFHAHLADTQEGPFLRTGDLGFLREDGELFVTGRIKDVVIIRGKNHYPQDLEQTVQKCHPALRVDAGAAFAVEVAGEEKVVVVQEVERTHLRKLNYKEIISQIRQALTAHHGLQVHDVVLIKPSSLPKTSSGKIQRYQCRSKFLQGMLESVHDKMLSV